MSVHEDESVRRHTRRAEWDQHDLVIISWRAVLDGDQHDLAIISL